MKREYCRACSAPIEFDQQKRKYICEYCGSIFEMDEDDAKTQIKEKASALFKSCDFDGAKNLYQSIIARENDSESYWFIALCKYGIQFVDDPRTNKKIPTCHRTLIDPIIADPDYESALMFADELTRSTYKNTAEKINDIQKRIIQISNTQSPYDVFICYKETRKDGTSTDESKIAKDLYYKLKMENYRVFYAPETLQDKAGFDYEPYIFAAISSAKIMFVIGFTEENYNAVWVKNEWSRFMLRRSQDSRLRLVCCYRSGVNSKPFPMKLSSTQAIDLDFVSTNDIVTNVRGWYPKNVSNNIDSYHSSYPKNVPNNINSYHSSFKSSRDPVSLSTDYGEKIRLQRKQERLSPLIQSLKSKRNELESVIREINETLVKIGETNRVIYLDAQGNPDLEKALCIAKDFKKNISTFSWDTNSKDKKSFSEIYNSFLIEKEKWEKSVPTLKNEKNKKDFYEFIQKRKELSDAHFLNSKTMAEKTIRLEKLISEIEVIIAEIKKEELK